MTVMVANVWIDTPQGPRGLTLKERGFVMSSGETAWIFEDDHGQQVITRTGWKMDLLEVLRDTPKGLCLEFGVSKGESLRRLVSTGRKFHGFDTWKGLPHDWNDGDLRGSFKAVKPDIPNCELYEGLFSDTLPAFLAHHHDPVAFVHIDCDLYASCIYVLHCLVDRFVKGSVIAFDEIDQGTHFGELQAWCRYKQETGQVWELLGKQHAFGEVYRYTGYAN